VKSNPLRLGALMILFLSSVLASMPAAAQQVKSVAGVSVNFGVMSATAALRAEGHRDAHAPNPPSGSQHLLITLDDEKSRARIADAEVSIEVTDPHGRVEMKPMLHTQSGGLPDYSELFTFGWSGEYKVRVIIKRPGAAPIETVFTVHHAV
jgi:hypothetical protein